MFLSEPDIELLKELSVAVDSNLSADELAGLCRETALRTDDRLFPFTYAGILLAVKDRISDAIKIMEFSTSHPIPFVIREYLVETQSFEPGVTVFQDTRPLADCVTMSSRTSFGISKVANLLKSLDSESSSE